MTRDEIIERLTELGFVEITTGLVAKDGAPAQGFRHSSLIGERASLYVADDHLVANGLYAEQLAAVPPTRHGHQGNPCWQGEALQEALKRLEERYLSQGVRNLLRAFDALPPAERHQAATIILRRSAGAGEMPEAAYAELAGELSRIHDAEEAADANP